MKLSKVLLIGLVLALVPVTGTLWALAQGDGFDIHACVNPSGKLRIVDDVSMCKAQETELEWNIQGPRGEQGPPGDTGVLEIYTVGSGTRMAGPGSRGEAYAECDAGDLVTGGGFVFEIEVPGCGVVEENFPEEMNLWKVEVKNECDEEVYFSAWAVCADWTPQD